MTLFKALLAATVSSVFAGVTWCEASGRTASPPPPPQRSGTNNNNNNTNANTSNNGPANANNDGSTGTNTGSNSGTGTGTNTGANRNRSRPNTTPPASSGDRRQNPNQYPNGYPYNPYGGYPYAGVYSPGLPGSNGAYPPGSTPNTGTPSATDPPAPGSLVPDPVAAPTTRPSAIPAAPTPADPELSAATAALDDAVARVKYSLKSNPEYISAMAVKQAAKDEATALREKGEGASSGDLVSIAQRGLEAGRKITAIERDAMAQDSKVIAARARLDAAIAAHKAGKGA